MPRKLLFIEYGNWCQHEPCRSRNEWFSMDCCLTARTVWSKTDLRWVLVSSNALKLLCNHIVWHMSVSFKSLWTWTSQGVRYVLGCYPGDPPPTDPAQKANLRLQFAGNPDLTEVSRWKHKSETRCSCCWVLTRASFWLVDSNSQMMLVLTRNSALMLCFSGLPPSVNWNCIGKNRTCKFNPMTYEMEIGNGYDGL